MPAPAVRRGPRGCPPHPPGLVFLARSPRAGGPPNLSSTHSHLMVTDTALMSEGDNTWELKITIAST